jgi:hypothetical protein
VGHARSRSYRSMTTRHRWQQTCSNGLVFGVFVSHWQVPFLRCQSQKGFDACGHLNLVWGSWTVRKNAERNVQYRRSAYLPLFHGPGKKHLQLNSKPPHDYCILCCGSEMRFNSVLMAFADRRQLAGFFQSNLILPSSFYDALSFILLIVMASRTALPQAVV